ncbi:MFS transporter [Rhodococcus jostii]|uniref:Nitrate/nitrite transporter NarK n=1 Tax=Rhodococcus jostii TaxID=132919 RepID=A0A1H5E0D2_RHOJO|nr:MFS transporter [Rhodococcus jostii]SED84629.1 Nitrate/nitrite transporter NarK [Rhodococcus jostii]
MLSPWVRLAAAMFAVSWGANQFAPMQLVYREHLGLGSGSFTAMLASYVVGLIPALLYFGRVSDRFGRRAVILPMIPVGIVSSLVLIAGAAVPDLLYLGRVLAGLASGMAFGAGTAWMKELSSAAPAGAGARRAAVSLSAGFGCGALFAGVIAQWLPVPELLPYLVHIVLMVGALALVWSVPDARDRVTSGTAKPLSALSTPQFRWGIAPWTPWVFGVATVSFATLPPLVSESLRSTSVAFTGLVAALTLLTGAVIQPWATRWSQRGDAAGIRVGVTLGVLGFGAATVVAYTDGALSVAAIVVAAFLLGSCYGILLGSGLASIEKLAPADELAQTVAVFYCLIYIGFAVPFVISVLAPHLGFATCFVGAALLMLVSVAVGRKAKDRHLTRT